MRMILSLASPRIDSHFCVTGCTQGFLERARSEVDERLGKREEGRPSLAIRFEQCLAQASVAKKEGKVERLRERLERPAKRGP